MTTIRWLAQSALVHVCFVVAVTAQAPDRSPKLRRLLLEMESVSDAEWQDYARELHQQVLALERKAQDAMGQAAEIRAQLDRLEKLRVLLGSTKKPQSRGPGPASMQDKKASVDKAVKKAAATMARQLMSGKPVDPEQLINFEDHVFEIFDMNCTVCHEAGDPSGGLDLSNYAAAIQGGSSGRTLRPGDVDGSRLYALITGAENPRMPPEEPPIPRQDRELIRAWIAQGAPKDAGHAQKLAQQRAAAVAKAASARDARGLARAARPAVMPPALLDPKAGWPVVPTTKVQGPPAVRALAHSPTSPLLAIARHDQVVLVASQGRGGADAQRPRLLLGGDAGPVQVLEFSADGSKLMVVSAYPGHRGVLRVYNVRSGAVESRLDAGRDSWTAASLAPDGSRVAFGGATKRLSVRSTDGVVQFDIDHDDWVLAAAWSPNGKFLASADRSGGIRLIESDGREGPRLSGARHKGAVHCLQWSEDSATLISGGDDGHVMYWRVRDGRRTERVSLRHPVLAMGLQADGRLWVGGARGLLASVAPNRKGKSTVPRVGEWVYAVAASRDRVFAGDWRGRVHVIDAVKRERVGAPWRVSDLVPLAASPGASTDSDS